MEARMRRIAVLLATLLVLSGISISGARALEDGIPTQAEYDQAKAQGWTDRQLNTIDHVEVVETEDTGPQDTCRDNWYISVTYYNKLNWKLMRLRLHVDRCWDGRLITYWFHHHTVWVAWWTQWEWKGLVGHEHTGGAGHRAATAFHQGHFQLCIFKIGCISNRYPWIKMTVYGNGRRAYSRDW